MSGKSYYNVKKAQVKYGFCYTLMLNKVLLLIYLF